MLVPEPLVAAALLLGAQGGLALPATWPALPPGTAVSLQAWLSDAGGRATAMR